MANLCCQEMVIPFSNKLFLIRASLVAQQETKLRFLDLEDLLEKGMVTHSSILAWRISWTKELSMGSQRVRHVWGTNAIFN